MNAAAQASVETLPLRSGGYDPSWFDALSGVEDRHFWFRSRNEVIASAVRPIVAERGPDLRVLEVGCGNGNVLRVLKSLCPDGEVVGLDFCEEGLNHARQRCDCKLVRGDIRDKPFPCDSFDLIGMFDVLEHLSDDVNVLKTLHATLAPGGSVVLTVPACPSLWSYFDAAADHCRRYRETELLEKLRSVGFDVVYSTYFMMTIFPVVWAGRRWQGRRNQTAGCDSSENSLNELKVRCVVNGLLLRLLAWERWWIARQRRLPIGTSLLAVARKSGVIKTVGRHGDRSAELNSAVSRICNPQTARYSSIGGGSNSPAECNSAIQQI
jgi:SAM-dependent methyltransferase